MADNKLVRKLFHLYFLLQRPLTFGVRVIVENEKQEILLVKHTYVSGWYLPGGGVETHETLAQTAHKELREETGIRLTEEPALLGVYKNRHASKRDHLALFKAGGWERLETFEPNKEIAEIGFFALDALPDDVTSGNLKRIREHYFGDPVSPYW